MDKFSIRNGFQIIDDNCKCSKIARTRIWQVFAKRNTLKFTSPNEHYDIVEDALSYLGLSYHFGPSPFDHGKNINLLCNHITTAAEWYSVFDFIEYDLANTESCETVSKEYTKVLEEEKSGYRIVKGLVVPITNNAEIASIEDAYNSSPAHVAESIKKSLELYRDFQKPDYNNAIKEIITAVEAMCCTIVNGEENTLGKAIDKLADYGVILNDSLKEVIKKLYRYTCSEEGIRHGGTDYIHADVSDAKFMIVTCSAIINYLIEKWEKVRRNQNAQ